MAGILIGSLRILDSAPFVDRREFVDQARLEGHLDPDTKMVPVRTGFWFRHRNRTSPESQSIAGSPSFRASLTFVDHKQSAPHVYQQHSRRTNWFVFLHLVRTLPWVD